ncbi:multisubstrate pseudouridine synthase 7 [Arachis ipaensis]|uniref:multisubstrate pseudouridine synthase 7 n=1 Tax=Arachis ipaensis TaxID=130454 RepID=UPI0007AF82AB|nr:multisubstrate pseudouridine synthase 7 [Arachis ipaensis]XP_025662653.1 multisubstrate pseudouridine synthase 7 [Arachis hypogaea]QHN85270.1 Multisubstrate pseudouridine synthase [Arachis hypogaea]
MAMKTVEESHVGISCYISNLPGFRGVLKQRYSDFIVNEVDRDGQVVHLSSLDAPPEEEQRSVQETGTNTSESDTTTVTSYAALLDSFKSLAGDSDAGCLEEFLNQINTGDDKSVAPLVLSPDSNKSHRTAVHKFFKGNFKFLVTDTVDGPDASSKCIRVRLNSGGPNNNGRNSKKRKERGDKPFDSRGSKSWPENVEKFLRFHLYKENKDTQEALGVIGKMLGIQSRSFGFAGTKDKRAVSTQRVTVYKQLASRVASLNERLFGIKVGDFCYVNEGLVLGQLSGNRFTITLRGVVADSEDTIKASADALGRHGFINYFGLQRFGSGSVPTHLIGAALFRGEWELAVDMILDPRDGEKEAIAKARKYYKDSKDIEGTLRQLPRYLVAERAVLQNLKKSPGNYVQALKAIPRTLRMMYVHSYQSFLWNHAASTRVQKYGTEQVVLGDLVYCKENPTGKVTGIVGPECDDDCGDRYDSNIEEEVSEDTQEESNNYVKVVTAEDLNLGCYTIEDVILPMPGSRVIYPTNDVAKVYHDLADKDRISLTECVHNVKEFSITNVTGSYRRVFQKPINFEWELLKYADSTKPLVETDLDKIIKSKPVNGVRPVGAPDAKKEDNTRELENSNDGANIEADDNEIEGEEVILPQDESVSGTNSQDFQTALKMSFTLPTSCYATMAIRELLKTSTSVAYHKTLNQ